MFSIVTRKTTRTSTTSCIIKSAIEGNRGRKAAGGGGISTVSTYHRRHLTNSNNDWKASSTVVLQTKLNHQQHQYCNYVHDQNVDNQCNKKLFIQYPIMIHNNRDDVFGSNPKGFCNSMKIDSIKIPTTVSVESDLSSSNNDTVTSTIRKRTTLLSGIEDMASTKLVWKESLNDYVFNIIVTNTGSTNTSSDQFQQQKQRSYDIPMNHILRSTMQNLAKNNVNTNNNHNFQFSNTNLSNSSTRYNDMVMNSRSSKFYNRRFNAFQQQEQVAYFSTSEQQPRTNNDDQQQGKQKIPLSTTTPNREQMSGTTATSVSRTIGTTQIPTPESLPPPTNPLESLKKATPKGVIQKGLDMTISVFRTVITFIFKIPPTTYYYITHPKGRKDATDKLWKDIKHEAHHYWVGTKLLWSEIQTAKSLLQKTLHGSSLTRRERRQLLRTVSDLFRLIPFSMFVIIPFMEFALPFALRIFPNLLPSTYQDSLKAEEDMKRELKTRIAMAQFFQETLEQLAKEQTQKASQKKQELAEAGIVDDESSKTIDKQQDSAGSMLEFLSKARRGEMIPPDVIIRYAKYFQDDLTLGNMPRMQLINMCRYMGIPPYGNDNLLRFQLRLKIRNLKEDDQKILWEGIDSLTKMELREACQERGMRSTGLSKEAYKRNLQQWLDLSVHKDVPISLLIMSRTFFLQEEAAGEGSDAAAKNLTGLADAISGLDKEIVNEVILEVATTEERKSDYEVRKIKLEVLSQQNELIKEEEKALKEEAAKLKAESAAKAAAESIKEETVPPLESPVLGVDPAASMAAASSPVSEQPTVSATVVPDVEKVVEKEKKVDKEGTLSTEEMDAISQFISQDPVSLERAELQKIKAAMKAEEKTPKATAEENVTAVEVTEDKKAPEPPPAAMTPEETEKYVKERISEIDQAVAAMTADATTTMGPSSTSQPALDTIVEEVEEDPVVARLKKRVESMVGKIEVQLSTAEELIGDKLHFLDRDKDGILSREEMAHALQTTLKRELTFEQALQIADAMDENKDGVFTVAELSRWIDENKLVRFFEEGRDLEADRIIANVSSQTKKDDSTTDTESVPETPK